MTLIIKVGGMLLMSSNYMEIRSLLVIEEENSECRYCDGFISNLKDSGNPDLHLPSIVVLMEHNLIYSVYWSFLHDASIRCFRKLSFTYASLLCRHIIYQKITSLTLRLRKIGFWKLVVSYKLDVLMEVWTWLGQLVYEVVPVLFQAKKGEGKFLF